MGNDKFDYAWQLCLFHTDGVTRLVTREIRFNTLLEQVPRPMSGAVTHHGAVRAAPVNKDSSA